MNNPVAEVRPIPLGLLPDRPLVSILMSNYNYAKYIGEAIESVLAQTYSHWELIVCDDGSTDNSPEIVREYQERDPRIKLICKENGGQASALNAAYVASVGQVIALLDADDVFAPAKIECVVNLLRKFPSYGVVVHRLQIVDSKGVPGIVFPIFTRLENGYLAEKLYRRGGRWNAVPATGLTFRREAADEVFPLNEKEFRAEADGYLFTILPLIVKVISIDRVLAFRRIHEHNLTGFGEVSIAGISKELEIMERRIRNANVWCKHRGMPPLDLERNLSYRENKFLLRLLDRGTRTWREVFWAYRNLIRWYMEDDMYDQLQRMSRVVFASLLPAVPSGLRPRVIRAFRSPSGWKWWVRKLIRWERTNAHSDL